MATQSWTIIDVDNHTFEDDFAVHGSLKPGMPDGWSVKHRLLHGGKSDGVSVIELSNGRMMLAVLPTRGMGLWKAWLGDKELGWKSPANGPVHPKFVPIMDPNGLGWLEGFDELMVRCGLESNGAPDFDEQGRLTHPLHGRVGNLPAKHVEVEVDEEAHSITVRGVVEEARFHFQKLRLTAEITTKFNATSFELKDEVANFGGTAATAQMLYHINIGDPILDAKSKVVAPVSKLAPRNDHAATGITTWDTFAAPTPGYEEQVYFAELVGDVNGDTQVLLKNSSSNAGVAIHSNKKSLPCFTLWKNTVASQDGYVTGLEPGSNFPNPRSFETEQGRVIRLAAGQTWKTSVRVDWLTSASEVSSAESSVRALQGGATPTVHEQPLPEWSA